METTIIEKNTKIDMIEYNILSPAETVGLIQREEVADFLFVHLDEYGDKKQDILKAIDYALNTGVTPGGFIVTARQEGNILLVGGAVQ